jgi:hypothetical protein
MKTTNNNVQYKGLIRQHTKTRNTQDRKIDASKGKQHTSNKTNNYCTGNCCQTKLLLIPKEHIPTRIRTPDHRMKHRTQPPISTGYRLRNYVSKYDKNRSIHNTHPTTHANQFDSTRLAITTHKVCTQDLCRQNLPHFPAGALYCNFNFNITDLVPV